MMNLDATGPEEIRAAFTAAIVAAEDQVDEIGSIAGVFSDAADRYEALEMQASTVEHLRDAGRACGTAQAAVATAAAQLRTALVDFGTHDGAVAEVVAEAGALASKEILMGDGPTPHAAKPAGQVIRAADPATMAVAPTGEGEEPAVKDRLRVGGRFLLRDGERFAGSGFAAGSQGELVLGVAVDTPVGRQVHLAVPIYPEDRSAWRGGHAPSRDVVIDEDGEEWAVDTGADATVVLDAADSARLPEVVEDIIAHAVEADRRFRQVVKDYERLHALRSRLEGARHPDRAQEAIALRERVRQEERTQEQRRRHIERAVARLTPADRMVYHQRQQRIDAAGRDAWNPDGDTEAAEVCGLTVEEYREMRDLDRIPFQQRTAVQSARLNQLKHGGGDALHPGLPPLLAEQAALVCGLTLAEYREKESLERLPKRSKAEHCNRGRRVRTHAEQARLDELDAAPGGATRPTPRATYKLRGEYLSMLRAHHAAKARLADARAAQAAMDATARPLDQATASELARVTTELEAVTVRHDEMAGWASASTQIPARNGGALVVEALQEEDGGVSYRVDRQPVDADEDWNVGSATDPFTTTPGGLRKVAKLAHDLAGASVNEWDRPPPGDAVGSAGETDEGGLW
ncbi:hypothetical protein [Micromonospora carbonacea]|uniref:Uncharacterized protein n=1 Tax=Micromonospora carbonacea TaxID=47853 RepID=A0A1C5AYC1_9ACTN|nr:hypothetical protein [Micromonospora carbonacea]SCF50061.1 hypothetical protein GA0070563_12627 [Micromonospora carbonacea]